MSADEVESEASNDGHVLCAVPLSVSGEIVLELDIEDPVHAFDAPVSADGGGDAVDVERGGGAIASPGKSAQPAIKVGLFTSVRNSG